MLQCRVKAWKTSVKKLGDRHFAAMALLSIMLPVGLLVSFRMVGIIHEPQTLETIPVQPTYWSINRPVDIATIDNWVGNNYADNIISINMNIHIVGYRENWPDFPSYGGDAVDLRIVVTASVSSGFICSFVVRFLEMDSSEIVYIDSTPRSMSLINLQKGLVRWSGSLESEAFFEAKGLNQPRNASLSIISYWVFLDQNNLDHMMTVTLEATYFDGAAYKKAIIPIKLGVMVE